MNLFKFTVFVALTLAFSPTSGQSVPSPTPPAGDPSVLPSFSGVKSGQYLKAFTFTSPTGESIEIIDRATNVDLFANSAFPVSPNLLEWELSVTRSSASGDVLWTQTYATGNKLMPSSAMWLGNGAMILSGTLFDDVEFAGKSLKVGRTESGAPYPGSFIGRVEANGTWAWLHTLDATHTNRITSLHVTEEGFLEIRGEYGLFRRFNVGPVAENFAFPDGRIYPLPLVNIRGVPTSVKNQFVSVYALDGTFLGGSVKRDPADETILTAAGEIPLESFYRARNLLYFNQQGEFIQPSRAFYRSIYGRLRPDLLPIWDAFRPDVRFQGRLSNGSFVFYGRGQDVPREWTGSAFDERTFYLAIVDSSGALQQAAIFDSMLNGEIFIVDDQILIRPRAPNAGSIDLGDFLNDFQPTVVEDGTITLTRLRGPFSGLFEINRWRHSPVMGWFFNYYGSNWWWSESLSANIYTAPDAGLSSFWFYHMEDASWYFTGTEVFPWLYSSENRAWLHP